MDLDISSAPTGVRRLPDGRRDVEEWGLKVQKLANVFSVTLLFVSLLSASKTINSWFADQYFATDRISDVATLYIILCRIQRRSKEPYDGHVQTGPSTGSKRCGQKG